jgi:hypothetical protein
MNERTLNKKINRAIELRAELNELVQEINEALEDKRTRVEWQQSVLNIQAVRPQDSLLPPSLR